MPFQIQTFDRISSDGLKQFPLEHYEVASELANPDAILLRSYSLHQHPFSANTKAIARAGAGVNNIPIKTCTEKGIVVFNTPGANANAVKELVIAGLLLSSRRIFEGIQWARALRGQGKEIVNLVEQKKGDFSGPELLGKTLGVVGLGAIGMLVANAAEALGMRVIGYDPYISIDSAWKLSKEVIRARSLESLLAISDYVTIHVPLQDNTRGFIDDAKFKAMKNGTRLLNFARQGLIHTEDLKKALENGKVSCFVTDFPVEELLDHDKIIPVPHLGACTPESEANCARMAVAQLQNFLENGNIKHSVNFPAADMPRYGGARIIIANQNIPAMMGKITTVLADESINIADMLNQHRNDIAYNIIDVDSPIVEQQIQKIRQIEGVFLARLLPEPPSLAV